MVKDQKRKERVSGWAGVPVPIRCTGCPYPKVGIICRDADGTCTWMDMEQLGSLCTIKKLPTEPEGYLLRTNGMGGDRWI